MCYGLAAIPVMAGCPTSSGLQSSSFSILPAHPQPHQSHVLTRGVALGAQSSDSGCSGQNQCEYTFQYGNGSGTSGYYVYDSMYFDSIVGNSVASNNSEPVVFGLDKAVDGIFGFGQQGLSVISQLSSQGITPYSFSHCLRGENGGGGILVLGQIVEPNMVYTPLVLSQYVFSRQKLPPHYNVYLQSIAVNGQTLNIDSSVFATSSNRGTIIDSGTTLTYIAEEAYDPFVTAVSSRRSCISQKLAQDQYALFLQKYITTSSVSEIFPQVTLNFAGGASMILRPQDYLLQQNSIVRWCCIGIQKIQGQGITILGDLVLKDKIVVYDIAGQRIGWANDDCSSSVNVSTTTSTGKTECWTS
ncbi:hypothetical protein SASPL_104686 [Salvia splendens]|uniref:Peptidase A1 domain-containing protein n=1 Tax=Salvia splendens TaxID=180675 RepID=A0A8X9AAW6_SALSN|nr:hypothetical protein SASPL_104686 [Salvia splendens]